MKQYKIFVAAMLFALAAILVGCGDTGADATEEPEVEMTEEMEDMDSEMEMTEEADG